MWTPFCILICNAAWTSRLIAIDLYNHLARASDSPSRSSWEPVLRQTKLWAYARFLIPAGRWSDRKGTMYPWLLSDRMQVRAPMKLPTAIPVGPPACTDRDIVKCCGREFLSVPSRIRFQGGVRVPTPSRSFVVGLPLKSLFLLSRVMTSFSQKRRHRGHVRRLPEVLRRRTSAPASPTRSVCAPSAAARFSPLREPA